MADLLNIAAKSAGELIMKNRFRIPSFQRGYAWEKGEVSDLWQDLCESAERENYFLGLVILTKKDGVMEVIDGQQRLVTLTLLAKAISMKATNIGVTEIAEKIEHSFLRSMDYSTREMVPQISFVDHDDNYTLKLILEGKTRAPSSYTGTVSKRMVNSFNRLRKSLDDHIGKDEDKKLVNLFEFIDDKLNFAVFTLSDDDSANKIFEVVNARGRDLTQADLLKNYVLNNSKSDKEKQRNYKDWTLLSEEFSKNSSEQNFELFIRHAMIAKYGFIRKGDLYASISGKMGDAQRPKSAREFLDILMDRRELYHQICDPSVPEPATGRIRELFSAFKILDLNSVRPVLIVLYDLKRSEQRVKGMEELLNLVVGKMVTGHLGIGKTEKQFSLVARLIREQGNYDCFRQVLATFRSPREDFERSLVRRTDIGAKTLEFIRRSALQGTRTPGAAGHFHWVCPPKAIWKSFTDADAHLVKTIGNTMLSTSRPRKGFNFLSWAAFKEEMMDRADSDEFIVDKRNSDVWDAAAVSWASKEVAKKAADIWYPKR